MLVSLAPCLWKGQIASQNLVLVSLCPCLTTGRFVAYEKLEAGITIQMVVI